MLEPRRLAARNIAAYLASQLGEPVGKQVGYRVRGENKVSTETRLEIVTEGILTRMIQSDPELEGVSLLIFDEYHERSLHADTALAFALDVQAGLRDDLKILIMSATLDNAALSGWLPEAAVIISEGRQYPISYRHQSIAWQYGWENEYARAIRKLMAEEPGSALVFLPGTGEIRRLADALEGTLPDDILLCQLYGQLSPKEQQAAIAPAPTGLRKLVLTTNIAETSLTIEGVRMVVDSGMERVAVFNPKSGVTKLETRRIAKSSAIQRAGRAGRIEAGTCQRFYSEEEFQRLRGEPEPAILNSDLSSLVLELAQWGCRAADLQWIDLPPTGHLQQATTLLIQLGILEPGKDKPVLSEFGRVATRYSADPRIGAMLCHAERWGCQAKGRSVKETAAWLAAWMEEPPRGRNSADIRLQIAEMQRRGGMANKRAGLFAKQLGISLGDELSPIWLAPLLAAAFPDRIAISRGNEGRYLLANGHGASLDPDEPLSSENTLVVAELTTTRQGDSRIFAAVAADMDELESHLPGLFETEDRVDWDDGKGRLVAEQQKRIGALVVSRKALPEPDPARIGEALANAVRRKGLPSLPWDENSEGLLVRARCGREWLPELALPALDNETLLAELDNWLVPFMAGMRKLSDLKKLDLKGALEAYLGWDKVKTLNSKVPARFEVPTGSSYTIRYKEGEDPVLAVRMQEMYGQQASPVIAMGRVTLVIELLSPAQRPLQITRDLASFWQGAYREVQKEMKGRYPKHVWPDNPATHEPTRKTKRQLQG